MRLKRNIGSRRKSPIPLVVVLCALFVFLLTNIISNFIYRHVPRVHDEIDYVFQAKIFQLGRLYVPSPCGREFFDFSHMINNGRWYSQYTPGYPLLLLFGLIIGAPWLVNPLLATFSIILLYFLGKEIFDERIGRLTALLGAASIWLILMSSTMMSHTSSFFFTSFFMLFLFRSLRHPTMGNGMLAGLGLGMAFLIRPYNAALIAIPLLIYYAFRQAPRFRHTLKNLSGFAAVMLLAVAILGAYNFLTNGHPLRMGYEVAYGKEHGVGFGKTGYVDYAYTPLVGKDQIVANLKALNRDVLSWPLTSFWALLPLFWVGVMRKDYRQKNILLLASFFSLVVGLYFYWGTYVFIGARMFFEAIPIFFLLSAQGIAELPRLMNLRFKRLRPLLIHTLVAAVLVIFIGNAFFYRLPRWIWHPESEWYYDGFANHFAGVNPDIHDTIKSLALPKAVVIIKFLYHPFRYYPTGWWSTGFLYNDPLLRSDIIYVRDLDKENNRLSACYPDRKIYLYLGTLEKGMLLPLKAEGDAVSYGQPLLQAKKSKGQIELISHPRSFFKIFSSEFQGFLEKLYADRSFVEVDVQWLLEMGSLSQKKNQLREASHFYEAALQLEKQPEYRLDALNKLAHCYFRIGRTEDAQKISTKIHDPDRPRLFRLFPERGF
jgi:hypothetical protein